MSTKMLRLLAAILAFGLLAAACGGDDDESAAGGDCEAGQTDGDLNLYNWAEYIDPELKTQFEEEFGVTVNEDNYDSNEQMQPIISQGNSGYDLIVPSDYMVSILIEGGDIAPINRSAVPNISNLADEFASGLPFDPDATYSVPYQWGTTGLGVDLSVVGEDVPQTWGLIFDADLAAEYGLEGAITILNDPRETMGAALKYLGYSLNTTDQGQLDEAKAIVADATSRVAAYESDQYDELLVSGQTSVAHGYSGNFLVQFFEAEDPEQFTYFVPEEGGTRWVDNMAVVADAPHPCTAHAFINFLLDAENGAALTNWNYYASPNAAAVPFIDQEVLDDPIVYPADQSRLEFIADTGDFEIELSDAFNAARGLSSEGQSLIDGVAFGRPRRRFHTPPSALERIVSMSM
ncbi:MAG: spermidine/putrescine ABC transporter substrate-binding protein [Actinomycetota bacterium]|nr:spermidine/putrescine ABC transporter substrate-binding protein [Actinomycetota bacterium]